MDGYPICKMEAFVESISHLKNIDSRREITEHFIAAQGSGKYVKDYLRGITMKKNKQSPEEAADALLGAFLNGFKGID